MKLFKVFYQPDGDAILKTRQNGQVREIHLKQGDILLLPERVEHAFKREPHTIGSVIKRTDSSNGPPNNSSKVANPIYIKSFVDEHLDEINK